MLIINQDNMKYHSDWSVGEILLWYRDAQIDLPENEIKYLLKRGDITRAQMLGNWMHITPQQVEAMDVEMLSRAELAAILTNPKIARLGLKHKVFHELFPESSFIRAYDHITLDEAERYNVKLYHVIDNPTVSIDVKRALIADGFKKGELPISDVDGLRPYSKPYISNDVVEQLSKLDYEQPLITNDVLTKASFLQNDDLASRLLLLLCGIYDESRTIDLLTLDLTSLAVEEFYAKLKAPATVGQTNKLLERGPKNRRLYQYVAANGHFTDTTIKSMIGDIEEKGLMADMVSLYENKTVSEHMRAQILPHIVMYVNDGAQRQMLFDELIMDCDNAAIYEFCQSYAYDPVMFYYIQSPRAFLRTGLYNIEHLGADEHLIEDILTICQDIQITDEDADRIAAILIQMGAGNAIGRFYLLSGISDACKDRLNKQLEHERARFTLS